MKQYLNFIIIGTLLTSCADHPPSQCKPRPQNWSSEKREEYKFREETPLSIDDSYNLKWNGVSITRNEMNSLLKNNSASNINSRIHIFISEKALCNIPDSLIENIDKNGNCKSKYMCELELR